VRNRREFLQGVAGAAAGAFLLRGSMTEAMPQAVAGGAPPPKHKPVIIGGKRIKTVDVHAHINFPEMTTFLKGTPLEGKNGGSPFTSYFGTTGEAPWPLGPDSERIQMMDKDGIDVQIMSINGYWDTADRDLATRLIEFQNQKMVELVKATPAGRFYAQASVALQFPDLAAQQLEDGMKMGLKGAAIAGSVLGEDISGLKYDPFWSKAEELQAPIFMHPQDSANATGIVKRVKGPGVLANVIGNPLETTMFLEHMIFDGVFERHPHLRVCCAHGGGYLPAYPDRIDHGCLVFPEQCKGSTLKKRPTEYLKENVYVDNLVFMPEELRHLVAEMGATHIMLGSDYPYPWTENGAGTLGPVDLVLATPGLTDAQKVEILGGNACKWLGIPT
jgi:predicted TIM-barrel fold metal-dependent hydrolase